MVEDGDHAIVVETLQSLRESEPGLLVSVLDALGNLSLPSSLLGDITSDALGLLESAEPSTLPVLVRNHVSLLDTPLLVPGLFFLIYTKTLNRLAPGSAKTVKGVCPVCWSLSEESLVG